MSPCSQRNVLSSRLPSGLKSCWTGSTTATWGSEHTGTQPAEAKEQPLSCAAPWVVQQAGEYALSWWCCSPMPRAQRANTEQVGSKGPLTKSGHGASRRGAASVCSKRLVELPQEHKLRLQSKSEEGICLT